MIRPLIHRNAKGSLDWISKSAPVPLLYEKHEIQGRSSTSVQTFHTHIDRHKNIMIDRSVDRQTCKIRPFSQLQIVLSWFQARKLPGMKGIEEILHQVNDAVYQYFKRCQPSKDPRWCRMFSIHSNLLFYRPEFTN